MALGGSLTDDGGFQRTHRVALTSNDGPRLPSRVVLVGLAAVLAFALLVLAALWATGQVGPVETPAGVGSQPVGEVPSPPPGH